MIKRRLPLLVLEREDEVIRGNGNRLKAHCVALIFGHMGWSLENIDAYTSALHVF